MRLAAFVALYLISFLGTGIGVGIGNHPLQIPLVRSLATPGFLPNDPFVATLSGYASPLWQVVGVLARIVPWEPLLLVLFLIERAAVLYAFGRLAGALSGGRTAAVVAGWAFAALTPRPLVADGTMVANYFEHTGVAVILIALAATALVERRPGRMAVFLGLAIDCNVLYGIFALSYLLPVGLLERGDLPLRKQAGAFGAALLLGAPAFIMVAMGDAKGGAVDAASWVGVLRAYYPDHFFPETWEGAAVRRLALLLAAAAGLALAVRKRQPALAPRLLIWAGGVVFWLLVSVANARLLPIPQLFILHPARGGDPGLVLLSLGVIAALVVKIETAETRKHRVAALAALAGAPLFFYGWSVRSALVAAVVAVALELGRARVTGAGRWFADTRTGAAAIAIALVLASTSAFNASSLVRGGTLLRGPSASERALAAWARDRSPPDAVFLVDPSWNMFRSLAGRQPFVTWKEGAAMMWRKDFVGLWRDRMGALGGRLEGAGTSVLDLTATYDRLSDRDVARLAGRYRLDYWIVRNDQSTALPAVYEAGGFKVLALVSKTYR